MMYPDVRIHSIAKLCWAGGQILPGKFPDGLKCAVCSRAVNSEMNLPSHSQGRESGCLSIVKDEFRFALALALALERVSHEGSTKCGYAFHLSLLIS